MRFPRLSFVIPTYNSGIYIPEVLKSIQKQTYPLNKIEVIVVDDNSTDDTLIKIDKFKKPFSKLIVIKKDKNVSKGAAISTNLGIEKAKGEFVCLVDSDAILADDWIETILPVFNDKKVGMVAGLIKTANPDNVWAAYAGRELEDRYRVLKGDEVDHLSTCNTVYRRFLFNEVGLFDTDLYYGYDVDFSLRVKKAGYKIMLARNTSCRHYWKETLKDYLKQARNTGMARLKILKKFPSKKVGGKISGWNIVIQVPLTILTLLLLLVSMFISSFAVYFIIALVCLVVSQLPQTLRILRDFQDWRFIFFPLILLSRNIVWVWVVIVYNIESLKFLFIKK